MNPLRRAPVIGSVLMAILGLPGMACAEEKVDFSRDVLPILSDNCFHCHGPDAKEGRKGDLRLDDEKDVKRDRDGYSVVVPGDSELSELIYRITTDDDDDLMPPSKLGRPMTQEQKQTLRRWVEQGAEWGKHWALERVERPETAGPAHPVDELVGRVLEKEGVKPNGLASEETLIRRLKLDLTGLPPTREEIEEFLADEKPGAWERLVDRTLASPAFGERMAWDWLDAARYADSNGYQGDRERTMWPWRDWVVKAFNQNMPFDQFTVWQLAGDLLPEPTFEQKLATGFNRNHMINGEGGRIPEENRVEYVFDMTETMGTVWLGLTLNCCRCHDHKYDPLSQREYYQLNAFFNQTPVNGEGGDPQTAPAISAPSEEQRKIEEDLVAEIAALEKRRQEIADRAKPGQAQWEAGQKGGNAWTVLRPESARAERQKLDIQGDGSVLAGGENPDKDTYVIAMAEAGVEVRSIRLEALQHPSFAVGGKGLSRADSGNFVLTGFELQVDGKPVRFSSATATYEQGNLKVSGAIDKNPGSGWAVYPGKGVEQPHHAVFVLENPIPAGAKLQFTLKHESSHKHHVIGRCRLSASSSASAKAGEGSPLRDALAVEPDKRTKEQARIIADAYLGTLPEYGELKAKSDALNKQLEDKRKGYAKVMVMEDMPNPRQTFMLDRGLYNQRGEVVEAAVPASLPPLQDKEKANRLGLARWLVSRDHPLTSRVTVNRFWQMLFGIGLVKTTEDFGVQAEFPVQRELLDWLAVEFMESGWDVKALMRTIVTSETYRRSSAIASREAYERDPDNRLLARGARFRMPSWMIRDQALAVSGLLNPRRGGAPVFPYQPEGIWSEATFGKKKYNQGTGDDLHRRSLYTFWRRIVGPSEFFDSAKRQVCEVKPQRTNTPMHALNTLNNVTYVEAARALAQKVLKEGGEDGDRISRAGKLVLGRELSPGELAVMTRSLQRSRDHFSDDPESAADFLSHGESVRDKELAETEHAAWMALCLNLLNLDETLNKE